MDGDSNDYPAYTGYQFSNTSDLILTDFEQTKPDLSSSSYQSRMVSIYLAPVILFIGIIGNSLILLVMLQRTMRGTSTSTYLITMSLLDTLVLVTGLLPDWLTSLVALNLSHSTPGACKLLKFLNYTSGDATIWIRVEFSIDRFVAICFPLQRAECCLAWKAKYYALGAVLLACAKNLTEFWSRGAEGVLSDTYVGLSNVTYNVSAVEQCGYTSAGFKHYELYVRPWFVFALVALLPFIAISVSNVFIIRSLFILRRSRARGVMMTSSASDRNLHQTTAMCASASISFLVLVAPTIVLVVGKPYWSVAANPAAYNMATAIDKLLYYLNNSINFFLYCVSGQRFRATLAGLFCVGFSRGGFRSWVKSSMVLTTVALSERLSTSRRGVGTLSGDSPLVPRRAKEGEEEEGSRRSGEGDESRRPSPRKERDEREEGPVIEVRRVSGAESSSEDKQFSQPNV